MPQHVHSAGPRPAPNGFTILEIIFVLFLLASLLGLIIPRISLGDTLGSVSRKWVATLRAMQDLSMSNQKIVRLYLDLDQNRYWPMVIDGNQEKPPLDPRWAAPLELSDSIRFSDVQVGTTRKSTGRVDLAFYPNGRIDPSAMYLTDGGTNLLGIAVDPVTSTIRTTDQRLDTQRPWTIPDRIKVLLQVQPLAPPTGIVPPAPKL